MFLPGLIAQTITVTNRVETGATDSFGNPIVDHVSVAVPGCSVQPLTTSEVLTTGNLVTVNAKLFAPIGTPITATSAVTADGHRYELDGAPMVWTGPGGRPHHIEALLRRVTG